MRIFYIAEITGKVGIWAVKKHIACIRRTYQPDFIIANADKATGAGGLGKQHAGYLKKMGVDCVVGTDCIFQKKDLVEALPHMPFVLRPCNLSPYSPGQGYRYFFTRRGEKLAVISLLGRVGQHRLLADNPFIVMQSLLSEIQKETNVIAVDFSSLATAEKQTMAFFLAGKVSALIGSGTGAATADAQLMAAADIPSCLPMGGDADELPAAALQGDTFQYADTQDASADTSGGIQSGWKTAYITDAGRTGSFDSVGGHAPSSKIREYRTGLFEYPQETWQRVCVQGVDIELDGAGSARSIERVRIELPQSGNS